MSNRIPQKQNEDKALRLLKAKSRSYELAKNVSCVETFLAISAIAVSLYAYYAFPGHPQVQATASLYAFGVLAINIAGLERLRNRYLKTGALIQEMFDTSILEMAWNPFEIPEEIEPEKIHSLVRSYDAQNCLRRLSCRLKMRKIGKLSNWFPGSVGELPINFARFICQRASLEWDRSLRLAYIATLWVTVVLAITLILVVSIWLKLDLTTIVITVVSPSLPLAAKLYYAAMQHYEAAEGNKQLTALANDCWRRSLKGGTQDWSERHEEDAARRIQDGLFRRRSTAPMVPDWFYWLLKSRFEKNMKAAVTEMIDEAGRTLTPPS